jgi:hypothetical protein
MASRFVVNRTARRQNAGVAARARRLAAKNPSAKIIICSITSLPVHLMEGTPERRSCPVSGARSHPAQGSTRNGQEWEHAILELFCGETAAGIKLRRSR